MRPASEKRVAPIELVLDNEQMALVLAPTAFGEPPSEDAVSSTRVRLRYLQKVDFPTAAKAGRGRKVEHDLEHILMLAVGFSLLSIGVTAKRTAATVIGNWPTILPALASGWQSTKPSLLFDEDGPDARDRKVGKYRRLLKFRGSDFATDDALTLQVTTYKEMEAGYTGSIFGPSALLLVDTYALTKRLRAALTDTLRLRDDDVDAALGAFLDGAFAKIGEQGKT